VKAAAHLTFLPMGRGRKTGTAVAFSDEVGALVADVVLRQGGKEEGAQAQVYLEKKAARGVLGAPLTMEWVMMAEAVEAPAIGWLLVVSSCTDGEKVVRGGGRLWRKLRWCGDTGKAVAWWTYRRRSKTRPGSKVTALRHARSGGAQTAWWWRGFGQ
jgi:hypothetical protein